MLLNNFKRKCSHPTVLSLHLLWRKFKPENAASEWKFAATQIVIISLNWLSSGMFKVLHINSKHHAHRDKIWKYPDLADSEQFREKVKVSPKQTPWYQDAIQQFNILSWPCI